MTETAHETASLRWRRVFAWTYFVLVLCYVGWHKLPWFKADTLYVSPEGSDWNSGTSKTAPLRSINNALSRIAISGHVYILPGTYNERLHVRTGGTADKPLIIEAVEPANTKLTWSRKIPDDFSLHWRAHKHGIYRAKVDWPIYQVRHNGKWLFRAAYNPKQLEILVTKKNARSAFHYSDGELLIYLADTNDIHTAEFEVNAPVPKPREWGEFRSANIWLEADHVELRGLQCEFGIGSGVTLWNASYATIADCSFTGTNIGVNASHGVKFNHDLKLQRCLYHNYPQSDWRKVAPNRNGQKKKPEERRWLDWKEIYANYASSSLIATTNGNVLIEDCLVAHSGDGMKVTNGSPNANIVVRNNLIMGCTDDAFELDGPGVNVTLTGNVVMNSHQNLGISPVTEGPCLIENNLFLHPDLYLNLSQIKLQGNKPDQIIRNVHINNNVFFGNWLSYKSNNTIENVEFSKNTFVTRKQIEPHWPFGVIENQNRYADLVEDDVHQYQPIGIIETFRSFDFEDSAKIVESIAAERSNSNRPGPQWLEWERQPCLDDMRPWREVQD